MGTTDDNILGKEIIEICMFHDATASCPLAHSPPLPSCHANTEKIYTSVLKGLGCAKKGHRGSMAQKLVRGTKGYDCPSVEAEISNSGPSTLQPALVSPTERSINAAQKHANQLTSQIMISIRDAE